MNKRGNIKSEGSPDRAKKLAAKRDKALKNAEAKRLRAEYAKKRAAEREKKKGERLRQAEERAANRRKFFSQIRSKFKNRREGFEYSGYGVIPKTELTVRGDRASVAVKLAAASITITDIRSVADKTKFKIRQKDLPKAIAILDEMCYTYQISATYGIKRKCAFWLSRAGLLIGAAAAVACLNISYGYVWRIDISGNDKLSVAAIESALKSNGISVGKKKTEIDSNRVTDVLEGIDGVADASFEISGTTLYVRVLESKDHTVLQKSGGYRSEYDATVTRIVMRSGTAQVKRGDVVKRGDLLARGDVFSSTGEHLYFADCDADVYGNVAVTFSSRISACSVEYIRTGKSADKKVFGLFGLKIGKADCPFASYETEIRTANYDVLLPLYVTSYKFYETTPTEVERDIDEVAKEYAERKIEEMEFIGDFEYSCKVEPLAAGLYTVHLFLSGETLISRGIDAAELPPLETPPAV